MDFLLSWMCFHQNKLHAAAFHPAAECWSLEGDALWMWSWWNADVLSFLLSFWASLSTHTHLSPGRKGWSCEITAAHLPSASHLPSHPTPWQVRCCPLCSINNVNFIQEENTSPFLSAQFLHFYTKHLQHIEPYITCALVYSVQTLYTP